MSNKSVKDSVLSAISDANQFLSDTSKIKIDESSIFLGFESNIDSLGAVTILSSVEEYIFKDFGIHLNLLELDINKYANTEFATISSLIKFIKNKIRG